MATSWHHKQQLRELWTSEDTFATCLLALAGDAFGLEFLNWTDDALQLELNETFDVDVPRSSFDRLQVAAKILSTDVFTRSEQAFIEFCHILSGATYSPELPWSPNDAMEIAWGISESLLIEPPEEPFSPAIRSYIGHVLDLEGIIAPPDVLQMAVREQPLQGVLPDILSHPELHATIQDMDRQKAQAIEDTLRDRLHKLFSQLEELPLTNHNARELALQLRRNLHAEANKGA
jgi:hypothetical protein